MTQNFPTSHKSSFLLLFLMFFVCAFTVAQQDSNYKLLWKIEGVNNTEPSYLFGTMHVEDMRAFRFSDAVLPALESCKSFALEVQPDSLITAMANMKSDVVAKDLFKSVLSADEYQLLVERFIAINGYSFEDSQISNPESILALLVPKRVKLDDQSVFVDFYLLEHARTMQKPIVGLEDIETQLNHFRNLTQQEQRDYILGQLDGTVEEQEYWINELTEIYSEGDLEKIEATVELHGGFNLELADRNKVMCKSIIRLMNDNSLFSAVGTAHLPGKDGLITLLREAGYKVTPVEANFTGVADTYKIDESKMKWARFEDSNLGFSIETPQEPNYSEELKDFTLYVYHGFSTNMLYSYMAYDLRSFPNLDSENAFAERFMGSMAQSHNGTLTMEDPKAIDGGTQFSSLITTDKERIIKMNCFLKNGICYYQSVEMASSQIQNSSVTRFFNSLKVTEPKPKKIIGSSLYHSNEGAFSIEIPGEPIDMSKESPNPAEPEGSPYQIKMFRSSDPEMKELCYVRYNDMPSGFFLQDKQAFFDSMKESILKNGKLLSDPKTIYMDSYEGQEIEVMIQEKSHARMRVYIRGNRVYVLLKQMLNLGDKIAEDDVFFSSFKFEDYMAATPISFKAEDDSFDIDFFPQIKTKETEEDFDNPTFMRNSTNYYTADPNSGEVYMIGYGELQDYFKIDTLKTFYKSRVEQLMGWNDTIVKQKEVKVDNKDALLVFTENKETKETIKYQIWLESDRLYIVTAFLSQEALETHMSDTIFQSYKRRTLTSRKVDWYSSKTDLILKDLQSTDSLSVKRALGAFSYYDFEPSDLLKLHPALTTKYGDSLYADNIKTNLVQVFPKLHDSTTLGHLKNLYSQSETTDFVKATIVSTLPQIDEENALETYIQLMDKAPPTSSDIYVWKILEPFRDSLELATVHYKTLVSLSEHELYRASVLGLSAQIMETDKDKKDMVLEASPKILKFAQDDLGIYKQKITDSLNTDYTYHTLISSYLSFFNAAAVDSQIADAFTTQLIAMDSNSWYTSQAVSARLRSNLNVDTKLVQKYLDSFPYRFEMMKAYQDIGQFNKIPKKYKESKSFAKMSLDFYLYDDDYYPNKTNLLGKVSQNNYTYYAFELQFEEEEEQFESYLALIGPIKTISETDPIQHYPVTIGWEDFDVKNWKTAAKEMISEEQENRN